MDEWEVEKHVTEMSHPCLAHMKKIEPVQQDF